VDKRFLADHFGENDHGNLYKAYCGDVGCATLEHRTGPGGDDSGRQYYKAADEDDRTYRLKAGEKIFVPRTHLHRVGSVGGAEILEVAYGTFKDEDIVRLEDDYGRGKER